MMALKAEERCESTDCYENKSFSFVIQINMVYCGRVGE